MSEIALTKEMLAGCFAFFVEGGTTVDAITVAANAKPDNDPLDNWPQFRCVEKMTPFVTRKNLGDRVCPDASAKGYTETPRIVTTQRGVDLTLNDSNELVERLSWGLSSPIVYDTAQTPGADAEGKIYGWLKAQEMDLPAGKDHNVLDHWGYLTLEQIPTTENKYKQYVLRFTFVPGSQYNSINYPDPAA